MEDEPIYLRYDIDQAYNMGLENAVVVLEKSMGLSRAAQPKYFESTRGMINKRKIKPLKEKLLEK